MPQLKILHAATKTWQSLINTFLKIRAKNYMNADVTNMIFFFTFLLFLFAESGRRKGGCHFPICCEVYKAKDFVVVTFIFPANSMVPRHLLVSRFLIDELKGQSG